MRGAKPATGEHNFYVMHSKKDFGRKVHRRGRVRARLIGNAPGRS
jgi:hypothetical protein